MAKLKIQHISPFNLRLQPELKATMERLARKASRSLNAEITARLEQSLVTSKQIQEFSDGELVDELIRRWGREAIQLTIREKNED